MIAAALEWLGFTRPGRHRRTAQSRPWHAIVRTGVAPIVLWSVIA